jgi:hypothetical protein
MAPDQLTRGSDLHLGDPVGQVAVTWAQSGDTGDHAAASD